MSGRPQTRRRNRTRIRRPVIQTRLTPNGNETPDVEITATYQNRSCIDLTNDSYSDDLIDLTGAGSIAGSTEDSVVIVGSSESSVDLSTDLIEDTAGYAGNDIPVLDPLPDLETDTNESIMSPCGSKTRCPICMDNDKRIISSGRQLNSTICGHIFCNDCIQMAIRAQKCCPTCRKKLTLKQIHPLFL